MKTKDVAKSIFFMFMVVMIFLIFADLARMDSISYGGVIDAEKVLRPGQVYECVTSLANGNEEGWYAIVRIEDKYFGLKFKW